MKHLIFLLVMGIEILTMVSCSSDEDINFVIKISDDVKITENDIEFYDSSTCILFLKEPIDLQYRFGQIPDVSYEDFEVLINDEVIFSGVFYPADVAAPSPTPTFIGCFDNDSLNSEIIEFKFSNFPYYTVDERRNKEFINFLEKNNLLKNGISFSIPKIELSSSNDSILGITFRINNNDNNAYLIPNPTTMNVYQLFLLTGGECINKIATEDWICHEFRYNSQDEKIISINNLYQLKEKKEMEFSLEFKYDSNFSKGRYKGGLLFNNTTYNLTADLDLDQSNGRIWIGTKRTGFDFEIN